MAEKKKWRDYFEEDSPEKESSGKTKTDSKKTSSWKDYFSERPKVNWSQYLGYDLGALTTNDLYNRYNAWSNNYNAFATAYQDRYSGRKYSAEDAYVSDSADWLNTVTSGSQALDTEAQGILDYMAKYGYMLDPAVVDEITKSLTTAGGYQQQMIAGATQDNDYWNSFGTDAELVGKFGSAEGVYNYYKRTDGYQKKYNGMSSQDLVNTLISMADGEEKDWLYSYAAGKVDIPAIESEIASLEDEVDYRSRYLMQNDYNQVQGQVGANADVYVIEVNGERVLMPYTSQSNPYLDRDEALVNGGITDREAYMYETNQKEDRLNALKQLAPDLRYIQELGQYTAVMNNADFEENSQFRSTRNNEALDDHKQTIYDGYGNLVGTIYIKESLFGDHMYDYINRQEDALAVATSNDVADYASLFGTDDGFLLEMTDNEIKIYNYLYKTQGPDAANAFISYIGDDLQARRRVQEQERWAGYAQEHPILSSLFSIYISPMKGLSYIGQAADMLEDGKMDKNAGYNKWSYIPSTIRSTVSSTIEKGWGGKVGSYVYNTGMSMGDFLFSTAITGGNQALSLAIMGSGAAADTTLAAKDRGLSDMQAFSLGTIAGLAEVIMERISLGAWLDGDMTEGALKYVLKNAISEGLEETGTSLINLIADIMIAADKSEWMKAIQTYIDQGIPESEAFGLVLVQKSGDILLDALGGILSGTAIGGGSYAGISLVSKVQYGNLGKNNAFTNNLVQEGVSLNPGSKYIQRMQTKVNEGKNLSGMQVRNILAANNEQITANDMKKIQKAAEARFTALGQTGNVSELAEIATKWATGHELTRAEKKLLTHSKYGSRVANELLPENIASGDFTTEWAENIGTQKVNAGAYNMRKIIDSMSEDPTSYKSLESRTESETPANVSDTGKAVVSDTDQEIDLKNIKVKSVTKNSVVLDVNGKDVDINDVDFATEEQGEVFNALKKIEHITPGVAGSMIAKVDWSKPAWAQMNGMDEAFTYGYWNYSEADLKAGLFTGNLTKEQLNDAYKLGQYVRKNDVNADETARKKMRTEADAKLSAEQKAAQQKARIESDDVDVYFMDGKSTVKFDEHTGKYDEKRMAAVNTAKFLKKLGIGGKFVFYASYVNADGERVYKNADGDEVKAPNGMYKKSDGSIYIDLNAGNDGKGTTLFTLGHEVTHFIKHWSKKKFQVLADFLIEEYGNTNMSMHERVLEKQTQLSVNRGEDVSYDEAFEEVVADAMSTMFSDGNLHEKLAKLKAKDKSLFDKIKQFIDEMIAKFRGEYAKLTPEQRSARDVRAMKDAFDRIQTAFAEALVEASENFQAAENTTEAIENSEEIAYSKRGYQKVFFKENVFPPFNESHSEAHELAERWAKSEKTETGERKLISYHNQWYLIESFRNLKYGYQIMKKLTKQEYIKEASYYGTVTGYQSLQDSLSEDAAQHYRRGSDGDAGYRSGNDASQLRGENRTIHGLGENEVRWETSERNGTGDLSSSSVDSQGENRSAVKNSDRDSQGNNLSKEQQEFFNDSKIVDANGNLKVMYHGSQESFTVFDKKKARSSGYYGKGFYFTDSNSHAKQYGNAYEVYLNITHPLQNGTKDITKEQFRKFVEAIAENDDYGLDNYGERATVDSVTNSVYGKGDFAMLMDINASCVGDLVAAVELFNEVNGTDYDGIIAPTETVAFYPEQIKRTDNKAPTSNPDMRFSERDQDYGKVLKQVEKQNEKLKEDISYLKQMLKLQRSVTDGTIFTKSSVEASARTLKKYADASGDTKELATMLNELYRHIAGSDNLTWESVSEKAQPAVDWLMKHKIERLDPYAEQILGDMKGSRVYLTDEQKQNVRYRYGSIAEFKRMLAGTVVISDNANMSLDSWWHEMAESYPDKFDDTITSTDQPETLADLVDAMNGMRDADDRERAYNRKYVEQDLLRQVYDSYWNVSTLRTVADVKQRQIDRLKVEHSNRMRELKEANRESIQKIRNEYREKMKNAAKRRADSKTMAEYRHKIRKIVRDLDKLLNRGNKKLNVKEDMKGFASKALELADYLFTDHVSNDELIRKGITVRMTPEEAALVKETEDILSKLYDNADSLTDEEFARLDAKRKVNEEKLRDLLTAQRNERLNTPVYNLFNDLVTEYAKLKNSKQDAVKAAYSPEVERFLRSYMGETEGETDSERKTVLQNMRVADMTTEELWKLHNAYQMVLHSVKTANDLFVKGKTVSIEQMAGRIMDDFANRKIPEKKLAIAARNLSNKMGWDYEKLYYALDRIGSEAFTELVMNIANSENIVMQDVIEAVVFRDEMVKKYGFNKWAVNKKIDKEFLDNTGKKFELTLGQLMALYAYSRREGAWDHIEYGGFVFGEKALTNPRPADSYKLSKEQCEAITDLLTKEQKGYVEDMQKFLSETMGEKGNEVSMLLYGIKMFGEKNYFPIHIAGQYKAQAQEAQAKAAAGFGAMSNAGFTHAQNPQAKAPFVLEGFNEIWADHVNEMSRYHGTVPALEDMRRVMNRSFYSESGAESMAIKQLMENAFGEDAVDYFDNLYREANTGAITDKLQKKSKKLLSLFRNNSVAYSLSVLIQQPASVVRAYAMIDRKYFGLKGVGTITSGVFRALGNKVTKSYTNSYNEMLKYAPGVTMAKEIGGFDTHTGGSIRSYLLDTNKGFFHKMKTEKAAGKAKAVMELVDDNAIANLPNVADKIAWIEIWNACKRETVAKHKDLAPTSEEFMQTVGERFTEVIRATQVYDSMFSKSPMLKSKNLAVQYLVSFMNEPNTVANMVEKAIRDVRKGDKSSVLSGLKTAHVVVHSIIFTSLLKSIVYAMRDDDEDETYIEKYLESVTGSLMSDFNPLSYIPVARDVWSIAQGYDVERADMAIVADALDALDRVLKNAFADTDDMTEEQLVEFDKKVTEANWKLVESLAAFAGIPVKNIRREVEGVLDHARIAYTNAGKTTGLSAWDKVYEAVIDSIPFMQTKVTKSEKLYDVIMSGDKTYLDRLKATYKTDTAYENAVVKALRENDSRIHEAAQARYDGNTEEYKRIFREIQNEGNFSFDDIMAAINSELSEIKNELEPDRVSREYNATDFVHAVIIGDTSVAQSIREYLISYHLGEDKTQDEAEEAFADSVYSSIRNAYSTDLLDKAGAEKMLVEYADMDEEDATARIDYWTFCDEHPEYDFSQSTVEKYREFAEPANVSLEIYEQFLSGTKDLADIKDRWGYVEVSKRDQVLEVIDLLPLTRKQKDALYLAYGYAESKLWDVPW